MRRAKASWILVGLGLLSATPARAEERAIDATTVRYVSLETGGIARPRFVTARLLRFFVALEAKLDHADRVEARHIQTAVDRIVVEDMLSSLFLRRSPDPPDLPKFVAELRAELDARIAPAKASELLEQYGLSDFDLGRILYTRARAIHYADQNIASVIDDSEDDVRDAFRTLAHPFRSAAYEAKHDEFRLWLIHERIRRIELEFLESSRTRVRMTWMAGSPPR